MPRFGILCWGSFLAALLVGCSASRETGIPPSTSPAGASSTDRGLAGPLTAGTLYVANYYASTIAVFAPGASKPSRTISSGVSYPNSLTLDKSGNLYVGNFGAASGSFNSSVTVYSPGSSQPARTITNGVFGPFAMTVDKSDKLYVANNGGDTVTVYAKGSSQPDRTIALGIRGPEALAFDTAGNLYVANWFANDATVYGPKKGTPRLKITDGIAAPTALALDSAGNVYVANHRGNSITIYAPGTKKQPRRITNGVGRPIGLISFSNTLYVLNYSHNTVSAYDETTLARVAVTSAGVHCPSSMAMSQTGLLFVANACPSGISIFASSSLKLQRSIAHGVTYPAAVSIVQ
jgi:sugar lactone lactonase YvrE